MLIILFSEHPRQRSYSAPKKIRTTLQPVHTEFKPEEDNSENSENSETELSEDKYEGDEESESGDEDEKADSEHDREENEEESSGVEAQLEIGSDGDRFRWHTVSVNGRDKILDLKLLEPYMKVISHGGTCTTQCLYNH